MFCDCPSPKESTYAALEQAVFGSMFTLNCTDVGPPLLPREFGTSASCPVELLITGGGGGVDGTPLTPVVGTVIVGTDITYAREHTAPIEARVPGPMLP